MAIDFPVTVDSSKLAIEESLRLIDQQKVELYELIRQLNSRRNELAPISVLPPELLGRIFTFVISGIPGPSQYFTSSPLSQWNFTYVSQNWRNVALDTPSLWDSPTFLVPAWARAMLERSKMADLVVDSDIYLIHNLAVMKEVFDNHALRIREINLRGLDSAFLSLILTKVQPASLRLHSLCLSRIAIEWADDDDSVPSAFPRFPTHLLVQPDALRCLVIDRCAFNLYAQPRPLLTHLSVTRPYDRPLLSDFITALCGMPALETLKMVDSLPLAKKAVKLDLKVELPKLSSLHLSSTEDPFEVLNVIDFLIVPWTTSVKISAETISYTSTTLMQLSSIVSPLGLFFSRMTGNGGRRAYNRLLLHHPGCVGLLAWRNEPLHDDISTNPPDMDLSLASHYLDQNYQSIHLLDKIIRCLSPFDLQTLIISIGDGQDAIRSLFGQSTTIQTVELQSNAIISEFLDALTHKSEGYESLDSSDHSVSFSALQSLSFNRASFHVDTLRQLLDCLMERYERGAGVEKLIIHRCYNIGEKDVRLLREIVPDVEWDEIVLTDDYDDESDLIDYDEESQESTYSAFT